MHYGSYIRADYKIARSPRTIRGRSSTHLWLLVSIFGCAVLGAVLAKGTATNSAHTQLSRDLATEHPQQEATTRVNIPLAIPEHSDAFPVHSASASEEEPPVSDQAVLLIQEEPRRALQGAPAQGEWHEVTVKSGDTLSAIFSRLNIYRELQSLMELGPKTEILHSLHPGQNLHIRISEQGMEELRFDPDNATRLSVVRTSAGNLQAELQKLNMETRQIAASGTIKRSLYVDGNQAGLSDLLIMKLSELFGWDIDFALDIREGDTFTAIYEEYYRDSEKLGDGEIIAAEFTTQGRVFRVLRYTDSKGNTGYFTPDGRSVRRPFLRTPVDIARISSHFNLERRHPILNTIRAHRGVDYAAPTGTPIKATGDGIVAERGLIGGYGNAIILRHGSKYTTLYGHMSRFAQNTAVGQRVKQGQVIGYIGSTGLATGPHLHYEFRINGVHYNPLTVPLPAAQPLPETEMATFLRATAPLRARLDIHATEQVAME